MASDDKRDVTARRLDRDHRCIFDDGSNASDPVMIWAGDGWDSTPFQNAGFRISHLAEWLHSQGGAPAELIEVNHDGSASIYDVTEADNGFDVEHDRDEEYADEWTALVDGYGDRITGGDTQEAADEWRETGLDVLQAGEWIEAGVWDAQTAQALDASGVTPADVERLGEGWDSDELDGESLGYRIANGDISIRRVMASLKFAD